MLGSQTLEVVIGLIFIFLLLSLLATAVNELIMSFFSFRGKDLEKAIKIMLDDTVNPAPSGAGGGPARVVSGEAFYNMPLISKFAKRGKNNQPSYLSRTNFSRALLILLSDGNQDHINLADIRKTIQNMPEGDTKRILLAYLKDAGDSLARFRAYLETWYDEMMDRASGWYKRRVQYWLVGIGFVLALLFNADPFVITKRLAADPEARKNLVAMADAYRQQLVLVTDSSGLGSERHVRRMLNPTKDPRLEALLIKYSTSAQDSLLVANLYANQKQIAALANEDLAAASTVVGMGWGEANLMPAGLEPGQKAYWLGSKLVGLLITALAVSLGAPFWFDLLNKVMNIRGAGVKPEEKRMPVTEPAPGPPARGITFERLSSPPVQVPVQAGEQLRT
jgi:hypothetical protein